MTPETFDYADGPRRGIPPVRCDHCGEEIEATGERRVSLIIAGSRPYVWRHVGTGSPTCDIALPTARPYSDWDAYRQIEAGRAYDEASR